MNSASEKLIAEDQAVNFAAETFPADKQKDTSGKPYLKTATIYCPLAYTEVGKFKAEKLHLTRKSPAAKRIAN